MPAEPVRRPADGSPCSAADLTCDLDALGAGELDVAVVGGGMHGAWIARRAAEAGYRTALVERGEPGGATSANSLKILHGGLRYLQHLSFRRMRSSIRARREFARLAPDLVRPLPCVMPLEGIGLKSPWVLAPALLVNDVLSSDRNAGVAAEARLPRGSLISGRECREIVAPLADIRPVAGARWWDALALDTAALTRAPLRAAVDAGALVARGVEARGLRVHDGSVRGVVVRKAAVDENAATSALGIPDGPDVPDVDADVRALVVVDATGPWAGHLAARAGLPTAQYLPKGWVGALNLVLNRSLGLEAAVALPVARSPELGADGNRRTRELFFVPWNGVTLIGTDYHPLEAAAGGLAPAETGPPAGAVERFVADVAKVAPRARVTLEDVARVHWGVLPAEAPGGLVPRRSPVVAAGRRVVGAAGLVVTVGEKLTSAPVVAERVLRCVESAMAEARRTRHRRPGSGGSRA